MLSTTPLFSLLWQGYEERCVCGELALVDADGRELRSGEGHWRRPVRALHEPVLLALLSEAGPSPLAASALGGRQTDEVGARLATLLAGLLGQAHPVQLVRDSNGAPLPVLTAIEIARLYQALAVAPEASALGVARRALLESPDWLGGPEGVDTRLMQLNPGRLLARRGPGQLALGVLPSTRAPLGAALVIELSSSERADWAALAASPFLEALGLAPLPGPGAGREVLWHVRPERLRPAALDISPVLSERLAVWPGDTPFRRTCSVESGPAATDGGDAGWQLRVSSIQTTLHAGAHADAPNHVGLGGVGIDAVPLERYRGLCEVVRVSLPPGSVLTPGSLDEQPPRAPRVLFATGSYPDPERFESNFSALSAELIAWLEAHGVVLVGIDTPSVDPLPASDLPSHRATRHGGGMAILEGLVLDAVEPGLYELVALPLRIEGGDASPLRAALWPLR